MRKQLGGATALSRSRFPIRGETPATPSMAQLSEQVTAIMTAVNEFRTKNDEQIAELRAGFDDVVRTEELQRINDAISDAQAGLDEFGRQLQLSSISNGPGDHFTQEQRAYTQQVLQFIRRGTPGPEMAASVGSDPDGGYLVGEEIEAGISRVLGQLTVMRSLATVRRVGAATYVRLRNQGGNASGWVGETESRPATTTPTLARQEFPVHEQYSMPISTQTLLDDGEFDVEGWLAGEVSIDFEEDEGAAFVTGNGGDRPRGFISGYTHVANASHTAATQALGYIVSGASAAFANTSASPGGSPADTLIDLIHALRPQLRGQGRFLMNDSVLATLRKFKNQDGDYLWQPSQQAGVPSLLLGYPVAIDDNMPDIAADSYSIAFGDYARGYLITDRVGIRILRDPYTNKPYVQFYTTKRVGGGVQDFQAIKLLKFGTT